MAINIADEAQRVKAELSEQAFVGSFLVQFRMSGKEALALIRLSEQHKESPSRIAKRLILEALANEAKRRGQQSFQRMSAARVLGGRLPRDGTEVTKAPSYRPAIPCRKTDSSALPQTS